MTSMDANKAAPGGGTRPVLIVVDDHDATRSVVANAIRRRFGSDYEVVASGSPADAKAEIVRLHSTGAVAALIVANEHLTSGTGTEFLASTRDIYPTARRLVVADFGDNWVMQSIARAST